MMSKPLMYLIIELLGYSYKPARL